MKRIPKWRQELRKLHKLIVHNFKSIADNKEWYRLARQETKAVKKVRGKDLAGLCDECFGS